MEAESIKPSPLSMNEFKITMKEILENPGKLKIMFLFFCLR